MRSIIFSVVLLLFLSACGLETKETDIAVSPENTTMAVYDKLVTAPLNTLTSIDLSPNVYGEGIQITGIFSDKPEQCFAQTNEELTVQIEIYQLGRCDFTYVVENHQSIKKGATLSVIAAKNALAPLPTISFSSLIEREELNQIDLKHYLDDTTLAGFSLQKENISILSELGAEPIEDYRVDSLTISFRTPATIGWHRLSYLLINESNEDVKMGEILITVTDFANQPPIITNPHYVYFNPSAITGQEFTVDLANIPKHTIAGFEQKHLAITLPDYDSDGKDLGWQLSNLKLLDYSDSAAATGSIVFPLDANDTNNTSFTLNAQPRYQSTDPSWVPPIDSSFYNISYIVTNRYGSSSAGMISIFATNKEIHFSLPMPSINLSLEENSSVFEKWLPGPITFTDAMGFGNGHYADDNFGEPNIHDKERSLISVWDRLEDAKAYCELHADGLPTLYDMSLNIFDGDPNNETLKQRKQIEFEKRQKWPKTYPFLIEHEGEFKFLNLQNAANANTQLWPIDVRPGISVYATCVCKNNLGSTLSPYCKKALNPTP